MNCSDCGAALSQGARFCSSCEVPIENHSGAVATAGGAYVGGSVTAGGDFVGRDQVVHGDQTKTSVVGLQGEDLKRFTELFRSVYSVIDAYAAKDPDADLDLLKSAARGVEDEAAKGGDANPDLVRKGLKVLAKLAPDVAEIAINALTNPGAAVVSAVRLVAEQVREFVR